MDEKMNDAFLEYWNDVVLDGLDDDQRDDIELYDAVKEAFEAGWQSARYDEAKEKNS